VKVLITGGAGFIGSHIAERLLAGGHDVLVIDNFTTGRRDTLSPHPKLRIVEETIADTARVDEIFGEFKPDQVVHAAASYKDPENWSEDARTNVLGTANVVQASRRVGVKRFIYFQTALCYGLKPLEQPITLEHPILPMGSSYAISKTGGEFYIRLSDLNFLSFRLANVFGPRNLSGPLPTFYQRLTSNKPCFVIDTRRDFIFVDDVVNVVMAALEGKGQGGIYHVATGGDYSIKELFDAAVKALGIKLEKDVEVRPRNPDDVYTILLDPQKTNKEFNWKASTPLEAGVKRAIEWYKGHGVAETFTHLKLADKKH
jgi:UDP-glucose 4-epimerase